MSDEAILADFPTLNRDALRAVIAFATVLGPGRVAARGRGLCVCDSCSGEGKYGSERKHGDCKTGE